MYKLFSNLVNMKKIFFIILTIVSSLFINSCKQENDDFTLNYQYEYFPLDTGSYWIYQVDSVKFREGLPDSSRTYVREYIESFYLDNIGRKTARIVRSVSFTQNYNWQIRDIWFANKTQTTAEKIEENLRYIKLVFPPQIDQTWKGNQYIQPVENIEWLEDWDYTLETLNTPATIDNTTYDSTITVAQRDEENLIKKVFSLEKYALNKGLIYKELINLSKQDASAPWSQPNEGFIVKMTLKEYGIE